MQPIRITIEIHRTRDTEPGTGEVRGVVEVDNVPLMSGTCQFEPPDTPVAAAHRLLRVMSGQILTKAGVK